MEPSALHDQVAVFEAEDNCLFFLLGLSHAALRFNLALEDQSDSAPSQEDNLVYFILGLQSFSRHFLQALAGFQADLPQEPETQQSVEGQSLTRLAIRDLLL